MMTMKRTEKRTNR